MSAITLDRISFVLLYRSLFQYRPAIRQIIAFYLLWTLFELSFPFLTKVLVDQGIGYGDIPFIGLVVMAQLMLVIGNISSDIFKTWLTRHLGVRLNLIVVDGYFRKLISKTVAFFSKNDEGAMHQHVNDNLRIEKFLTEGSMSLLNAVFKLALFSLIMFVFDWRIGLVFILSIGALLGWDVSFLKKRAVTDEQRLRISSDLRSELIEVVHGIHDIKVNGLEAERVSKWYKLQDRISQVRLRLFGIAQYYQGGTIVIAQLRDLFVVFVSALAVVNGSMTLGALLAIQYLLGHSNKPTLDIMQFIQDYHDAKLSLRRLQTVYESNEEEHLTGTMTFASVSGVIRLDDVHFRYQPDMPCIEGATVKLDAGAKVALVGESGSGKSTLIKLLLKLQEPTSGAIAVDDIPLAHANAHDWRERCSVVLQDGIIFTGSVRYNVSLADDAATDERRVDAAIRLAALEEVVKALPDGLNTRVGHQVKNLSKGQAQRLLIARAIYHGGEIVILDEPTSAMDSVNAMIVTENLLREFGDKTLIMATHNLDIARQMDRVVLMRHGRVHAYGQPGEVLSQLELAVKA
jgi:ATP-binding cassette subfamily B protein